MKIDNATRMELYRQATFKQYKQAFFETNGQADMIGGLPFTDEHIREDAKLNDIELID